MLYSLVFLFHMAAAAATGAVTLYALYSLVRGLSAEYRASAVYLGAIAGFEVASGTLLAVISPKLSALALTTHIIEYVGVCAALEVMLYFRMKQARLPFPFAPTALPMISSMCLFAIALAAGL